MAKQKGLMAGIDYDLTAVPAEHPAPQFGNVWSIRERNDTRIEYGTDSEQRKTIDAFVAFRGWDPQQRIVVETPTKEEVRKALSEMADYHDGLKKAVEENPKSKLFKARLDVFEAFYLDEKGKLKPPAWVTVTGNRRFTVMADALAQILLLGHQTEEQRERGEEGSEMQISELDVEIHAEVPDYNNFRFPSKELRTACQIRENTVKTQGAKPYTTAEKLRMVRPLVEAGNGQTKIRNAYGFSTKGVALYYLVVICMYEERQGWNLKLWERLTAPPTKGNDIPNPKYLDPDLFDYRKAIQGSLTKGPMADNPMGLRCESESRFRDENESRTSKRNPKVPLTRPTKKELKEWIEYFGSGKGKGGGNQMMGKSAIEGLTNHACDGIREVSNAVLLNDRDMLGKMEDHQEGINMALRMDDDAYSIAKEAFDTLHQLPATVQQSLVEEFSAAVIEAWNEHAEEEETEEEVEEEETADA